MPRPRRPRRRRPRDRRRYGRPPQHRRLAEHGRRGIRVAGAQAVPACGDELLEPQHVHGGVRVQSATVRGLRDDTGRAEGPAQPRDKGLQGVGGVGRRAPGPDRVDQDPLRDRATAGERQPYNQPLQPRTWYAHDGATA
ncbi:hypothetical protein ACH4VX_23200 [Streptomyces sp. NPDC020731]|uniref:hypothetical protein n=1 Tax=Streptomyces sp. NPDC020731 TaxID=3365085 RepID=UPI0037B80529